jgi:hypothetical protein
VHRCAGEAHLCCVQSACVFAACVAVAEVSFGWKAVHNELDAGTETGCCVCFGS